MNERERNRAIIQAWNPNVLAFMDEMKEAFEGDVKLTKLFCEVTNERPNENQNQREKANP